MNSFRLYGSQLKIALQRRLKEHFVTVCAVNELELKDNGIYVVNTDCLAGSHWILIYVTEMFIEVFDSFGRHQKYLQNGHLFMQIIKATDKKLIITSKHLQHHSSHVCGWYCLAYAYVRIRTNSVQSFYAMFKSDLVWNDKFVVFTVKRLFQ